MSHVTCSFPLFFIFFFFFNATATTEIYTLSLHDALPVTNPFGPIDAPSADAPPIQFSLRARYDWSIAGGYSPFIQVAATHNGHSFTQAGSNPTFAQAGAVSTGRLRFENPAYTVYDASFGVAKDARGVNVYGENISNSNASVFVSTDQFIIAQTPLRPRVIGASVGYKF